MAMIEVRSRLMSLFGKGSHGQCNSDCGLFRIHRPTVNSQSELTVATSSRRVAAVDSQTRSGDEARAGAREAGHEIRVLVRMGAVLVRPAEVCYISRLGM